MYEYFDPKLDSYGSTNISSTNNEKILDSGGISDDSSGLTDDSSMLDNTVDGLLNKNNLTNVGCLNPKFTKSKKEQHFFPMNLKGKKMTLEQAIEKMNRMNRAEDDIYDVLIYNRHAETGYVGELHPDFIKEDLTDFNDVSQPQSKHFSNVFLQKKDCTKNNSYNVYIKKSGSAKWNQLMKELLNKRMDKIKKDKHNTDNDLNQKNYNLHQMENGSSTSYEDYLNQQQNQNQQKQVQDIQSSTQDQLRLYKTAEVSNLNAIQTLKQMSSNEDKLLEKNYKNINEVEENILTTSERINTLKSRYSFNSKIIRHLKTALLIIFILTLFAMGYYGVRDSYGGNISKGIKKVSGLGGINKSSPNKI